MTDPNDIYEKYDVPRVINAVGNHTRVGGSLIRPEAREAMANAADDFAELSELQARASELISQACDADAGYVTNGAASGLALATAACLARDDFATMDRLPDTTGVPDEVLVPTAHHIEYDRAFRLPGATLRPVGLIDNHDGAEQVKPWEIADAISEETAAFAYIERPRNELSLEAVVEVTDQHDIPVIVDAAAELPPQSNLTKYVDCGAAAVVFSGGKAVRGPQPTGIVAGDQWLIRSIALQHLPVDTPAEFWDPPEELIDTTVLPSGTPNYGLGRAMKVGKEEIAGLVRALELFLDEDEDEVVESWRRRANRLADELSDLGEIHADLSGDDRSDYRSVPTVDIRIEASSPSGAADLVRQLRNDRPRIIVGERHVEDGWITLDPRCLRDDQIAVIVDRIRAIVCSEQS
ncbi:aminotransferase class V-fold PLP-dependent enzyme [Haloarcula sp. GH36]|uniref:aminotransferase class V-fold PLP-dependent enzyme n=1 Tax=Haloarcula montana TaxID=3111776 RepID=UPI002D798D2A|nr:L-seryl-tRNA selenium transferase [Haloarcula sp. GH36]